MLIDPIADMLTRLANASAVNHDHFTTTHSKIKEAILRLLAENSFIKDVKVEKAGQFKELNVTLLPKKKVHVRRISKPGQRIHIRSIDLTPVRSGLGLSILTTSKGIMTNTQARKEHIGGELICEIY